MNILRWLREFLFGVDVIIVLEDGLVRDVFAARWVPGRVVVIDHDTEGYWHDEDEREYEKRKQQLRELLDLRIVREVR